jgi:hypothetical protein
MAKTRPAVCHYFVDEAGDLAVFGRKGRVLLGDAGVSRAFMVGLCDLPDPAEATRRVNDLRASLLADPYFKGVPSMRPEAGRTALAFHAKDDPPEVRKAVFDLIPTLQPKIVVSVRRKIALVRQSEAGIPVRENELYDDTLARACRNMMHRADELRVVIARRGKNSRQEALKAALHTARDGFNRRWNTRHEQPISMEIAVPSDHVGLQVTDYLLWAVQRLYERGEDRFFGAVADHFSVIHDWDDTRVKGYGRVYRRTDPLMLEKLLPLATR